ncbi:unnamed protein product [Protopolystoma xenopodis]|uniref:Uncharacterized protein n=1 Tax=Protopolystoma xenopodis TaxID=117903 RepID=A0A3S5BS04_9PLAT|nr:unnamed protein product [Protopolystoma xenopodis]
MTEKRFGVSRSERKPFQAIKAINTVWTDQQQSVPEDSQAGPSRGHKDRRRQLGGGRTKREGREEYAEQQLMELETLCFWITWLRVVPRGDCRSILSSLQPPSHSMRSDLSWAASSAVAFDMTAAWLPGLVAYRTGERKHK